MSQHNDAEKAGVANATHKKVEPFMQNRELSWLTFNERVLDQGADETVPLLDRLNFVSIFWSNLQEFFMVRVGSLTDLSLVKKTIIDGKSGMSPAEQIEAIHNRCHELYPIQERIYKNICNELKDRGIRQYRRSDTFSDEQKTFLTKYFKNNVMPFLAPQIINSRHPFPHLENGGLYVVVRLDEEQNTANIKEKMHKAKTGSSKKHDLGADGVTLGIIPMPRQCDRVIPIPGEGFNFVLLEHLIEMFAREVFSMYAVKHTNVICVTRNADLDATEGTDEQDLDYREHMKRILKKRGRLAPVRLECERKLSSTVSRTLLDRLGLKQHQVYVTEVPLNLGYTWGLGSKIPADMREGLSVKPFTPQWPSCLDSKRSILEQATERELLLAYPYESMDPFVQMLREAANDPFVSSIKITLYRLASQSHLAEALIAAAENGKEVTALFELRARFDESNNIEWSQRFEEAGCNVIYGFHDFKVHSKICSIMRLTENGPQYITQLGTGNYNEKTAKLYTDLSFITTDPSIGADACEFFRNMALENTSDQYQTLRVAPLQIKQRILQRIDEQIELAKEGKPCGLFFKTNSVTDEPIIRKITEASQAGVPVTLFVRGISCIVPGVKGYTENVRVVSIVGRLLEHSRIYGFGPFDEMEMYLSSADLMTRNMDKRIEIAWPICDESIRKRILDYIRICMSDTAKLRELKPDGTYTAIGEFVPKGEKRFDSQNYFIQNAAERAEEAAEKSARAAIHSQNLKEVIQETAAQASVIDPEQMADKAQEIAGGEAPVAKEVEIVEEPEQVIEVEPAAQSVADLPTAQVMPAQPADSDTTEPAVAEDPQIQVLEPEVVIEPEPQPAAQPAPAQQSAPAPQTRAMAAPQKKPGLIRQVLGILFGKRK